MTGDNRTLLTNSSLVRPLAIGLMIVGAAGFIATLVMWGQQVLFLLVSTIVTFIGLGVLLYLRRNNSNHQETLDETASRQQSWEHIDQEGEESGILTRAVINVFRHKGAWVKIDTRSEERSILIVHLPDISRNVVIVDETNKPVDVPEMRALLALTTNSGSKTGYYITGGSFTYRARSWVAGKPIRLITDSEIDRL